MYKKRSACCIFYRNFSKYSYLFLFFFTFVKIIHNYSWRSEVDFNPFLLDHFRWQSSSDRNYVLSSTACSIFLLYISWRVYPIFAYFLSCITEQINGNTFLNAVIFDRLHVMYATIARNVSRKKCFVIWIYFETLLILRWYHREIK